MQRLREQELIREREKFEALERAWYFRTYGTARPQEMLEVFEAISQVKARELLSL
jgi:hypothetical protein